MQESNDESRTVGFLQDWPKCGCGKARPILEEVTSGGFRVTCYGCKMMTFTFETIKDAVKCWSDRHRDMLEQDETMHSNLEEIKRLHGILDERENDLLRLAQQNEKFSKLIKQGNDFIQALWSARG